MPRMEVNFSITVLITFAATTWTLVHGHGRLIEPPSRSSMWRFGFKNPTNYNDNALFCGGKSVKSFNPFYYAGFPH